MSLGGNSPNIVRVHTAQAAFSGGELSPLILGRSDTERFLLGGLRVENLIARHQGPLVRRLGTKFVRLSNCVEGRLKNFAFSADGAEMLKFGCGVIEVGFSRTTDTTFAFSNLTHTYDGSSKAPVIVATPAAATWSPGGTLSAVNAGSYVVTAVATGLFAGSNIAVWTIAKAAQGAVVIAGGDVTVTIGSTIVFVPSGGNGTGAYVWGGSSGATSATVLFSTLGTFSVTLYRAADANYLQSGLVTVTVGVVASVVVCHSQELYYNSSGNINMHWTNCDGTFGSASLYGGSPNDFYDTYCIKDGTLTIVAGSAVQGSVC